MPGGKPQKYGPGHLPRANFSVDYAVAAPQFGRVQQIATTSEIDPIAPENPAGV